MRKYSAFSINPLNVNMRKIEIICSLYDNRGYYLMPEAARDLSVHATIGLQWQDFLIDWRIKWRQWRLFFEENNICCLLQVIECQSHNRACTGIRTLGLYTFVNLILLVWVGLMPARMSETKWLLAIRRLVTVSWAPCTVYFTYKVWRELANKKSRVYCTLYTLWCVYWV